MSIVKHSFKPRPALKRRDVHSRRAFGTGSLFELNPFLLMEDWDIESDSDSIASSSGRPYRRNHVVGTGSQAPNDYASVAPHQIKSSDPSI